MATKPKIPTANDALTDYNQIKQSPPQYADYIGHPWTKMYGDIVPESNLKAPEIRDINYYADNFGLDPSVANLQAKFDALTKAEYERKNAEYRRSEDAFYQNMAGQNGIYQKAVQDATSKALQAGASRGMQFANQFAAQNEIAEQNGTGALDIATQRNNLKAEEAEAYTQNAIKADDTIRQQNLSILGQAIADRANEVQRYAADASLEGINNDLRIDNYKFNMGQQLDRYNADAQRIADENRALLDFLSSYKGNALQVLAQMYGYDTNLEGNKYAADINARTYGGSSGSRGSYYNGGTTSQTAEARDILNAYKKALDSGDAATRAFMESEYGAWLIKAYDADLNKRAEAAKNSGLLKTNNVYTDAGIPATLTNPMKKAGFTNAKIIDGTTYVQDGAGHWMPW